MTKNYHYFFLLYFRILFFRFWSNFRIIGDGQRDAGLAQAQPGHTWEVSSRESSTFLEVGAEFLGKNMVKSKAKSWILFRVRYRVTPFFRTDPLLYNKFENMVFLGQANLYFVTQDTRIIRKLLIFIFFISTFFDEKKLKINNFLIMLVSWATKWRYLFLTEKIPYRQICGTKVGAS